MKLLVDMNLSPRWTGFLADADIRAAYWSDLGAGNAPDVEIMAFAKAHGYAVFTHDLDFSAILAGNPRGETQRCASWLPGREPEAIGDAVVTAVRQTADDLDQGALFTVEPSRMRLRLLSLHPRYGCRAASTTRGT